MTILPVIERTALEVIAAALALPIVEREIARLGQNRPTGNTDAAYRRMEEIAEQQRPLRVRRDELLAVILDA